MSWKRTAPAAITILLALMTGITKTLVDSLQADRVPWFIVLIIALIILNLLLLYVFARALVFEDFFRELKPALDKIRLIHEEIPLISQDETAEIEKSAKKVWVLTKDFWWDLQNQEFAEKYVYPNIQRGVEYRYIYPDSKDGNNAAEALVQRIRERCRTPRSLFKRRINVSLRAAPTDVFDPLIHEVVIYHGSQRVGGEPVAVICDINGKRYDSIRESRDQLISYKKVVDEYRLMYQHLEQKSQERHKV
jgi:hypothetical protein